VAPVPEPDDDRPELVIEVTSVEAAAKVLTDIAQAIGAATTGVRKKAPDGIPAIPLSDLQRAYAYCWGRWSQQLEDANLRLTWAGDATQKSTDDYSDADHRHGGGRAI
jgi:hypothetical protein